MNAHFRKPICLDRSYWTILSPGDDPITVGSQEEAAHELASLFTLIGVKVIEYNPAEGWCNDVTADFEEDEDDSEIDPFDGDYCHADHFPALYRSGRA